MNDILSIANFDNGLYKLVFTRREKNGINLSTNLKHIYYFISNESISLNIGFYLTCCYENNTKWAKIQFS
jgi:hypothetical protein